MSKTIVKSESVTRTNVSVWATTITQTVALTMQFLFKVVDARGLSQSYLQYHAKTIENGLITWLSLRQLEKLYLEAYQGNELLERWDITYAYNPTPASPGHQPAFELKNDSLQKALQGLSRLPGGTQYRLTAILASGAQLVPGWSDCQALDDRKLTRHDLGQLFDLHHVLGQVGVWTRNNSR